MLCVSTAAVWRSFQKCVHSKPSRCSLKRLLGNLVHRAWTSSGARTSRSQEKVTPVFTKALDYKDKVAIIDESKKHSYSCLYRSSRGLAAQIHQALACHSGDIQGKRISFLCTNDASYTVAQWATWMCGGTAVPLCRKHPVSELEYVISDSQSSLLLAGEPYTVTLDTLAQKLGLPCLHLPPSASLDALHTAETHCQSHEAISDWAERPAMIIYTSGTTGRPKGVLHTHSSLQAMVSLCATLISALRHVLHTQVTMYSHWFDPLTHFSVQNFILVLKEPVAGHAVCTAIINPI
ncbi:malonate--CoA ligase ACSF3, mitochondrial [Tachysurus ichikawai]